MSTYDSWKSTDPRDGEPDWNNERELDEDANNCRDCQEGNHETILAAEPCPCPCHGGQQ